MPFLLVSCLDRNLVRPITHASGWRVSTLGRITPSQEMEDMFWRLLELPAESRLDAEIGNQASSTTTESESTATKAISNSNSNSNCLSTNGVHANSINSGACEDRAEKAAKLKGLLDPEYTYIFELCGKMNKVVTVYAIA